MVKDQLTQMHTMRQCTCTALCWHNAHTFSHHTDHLPFDKIFLFFAPRPVSNNEVYHIVCIGVIVLGTVLFHPHITVCDGHPAKQSYVGHGMSTFCKTGWHTPQTVSTLVWWNSAVHADMLVYIVKLHIHNKTSLEHGCIVGTTCE